MHANNYQFISGSIFPKPDSKSNNFDLVICFGSKELLANNQNIDLIRSSFNTEIFISLTTAGEIYNTEVFDDTVSITGLKFKDTPVQNNSVEISNFKNSKDAGIELVNGLKKDGLKYVLVFSDGALVNGSDLVEGMRLGLDKNVLITGGLAGNAAEFAGTLVGLNQAPKEGEIVAVGFYGENIQISHGSFGGWDPFGLERTVTKSNANILYEIDDKNALDLYKTYLGEYAEKLPGSALLFPLSLKTENSEDQVVRTILNIDTEKKNMTFAGNLPIGGRVRFMKANFDKLIDAAGIAAQNSLIPMRSSKPKYALLISCVGRKLVLNERTEEEVEAVREILGNDCTISGFYSYGEITPLNTESVCQLHNQTMTITCFNELEN